VDLSGTVFVGVRGIAALVRAAGRAAENLTTLCVIPPSYFDLARHLRVSGLDELFDLHTSMLGCRAALARREPVRSSPTPSRRAVDRRSPGSGGVAGRGRATGHPDLRITVRPAGRLVVVRLSGPLSLRTVGAVATAVAELLLDGGRVVVDLSAVRLQWAPALQAFPTTLAAAGGWPAARLVLLGADQAVGTAVRAMRIDQVVPLARDLPEARACLDRRPAVVLRHHELPPEPGSAWRARALLRSACRDWQIEAVVPDAAIVVSELVTNAVVHAGTGCRVSLRLDGSAVHIGVRDHQSADETTLDRIRGAGTAGRGLLIVAALSRAQGVIPRSNGKTVWAVVALPPLT